MLGRLGQVGHLVHRDAALDAGDRLACGGNLLRILQIVECGAHDDIDQLVLTVIHNQHGIGEIACHGVRLIHAVLAEDDHRAIHLLGVVVRRLGVELAVLQRVAHRLGEAGELRAVEHTQRDVAILHILGLVAVGFLDGARCLLAVVRLYGGRLDVAQASDMEKEQQGHHHGDHHDGSDDAEHRLLTAANVLFARGALVVSLGHLRIPFEQTNCHQLYCHAVICVMR